MIKLNGELVNPQYFTDNTFNLKINLLPDKEQYCNSATITWLYEYSNEMAAIWFITRHLQNNGFVFVNLILPYIPNARMDRVKNPEDVFTLKYFAEFLNSLNFHAVTVLDPHSNVSTALINNVIVESPKKYIMRAINNAQAISIRDDVDNKLILFYPDSSAMKKYFDMFPNRPYVFGIKKRNWETRDIEDYSIAGNIELIKNNDVLIVDDICTTGGTALCAARKLKEIGARNVYLYVTHCERNILYGEILRKYLIDKIFTTNTLLRQNIIELIHKRLNQYGYDDNKFVVYDYE